MDISVSLSPLHFCQFVSVHYLYSCLMTSAQLYTNKQCLSWQNNQPMILSSRAWIKPMLATCKKLPIVLFNEFTIFKIFLGCVTLGTMRCRNVDQRAALHSRLVALGPRPQAVSPWHQDPMYDTTIILTNTLLIMNLLITIINVVNESKIA